jgi:hypothetical protein
MITIGVWLVGLQPTTLVLSQKCFKDLKSFIKRNVLTLYGIQVLIWVSMTPTCTSSHMGIHDS